MLRSVSLAGLALFALAPAAVFAQHTYGSFSGYGSVTNPGTGHAPNVSPYYLGGAHSTYYGSRAYYGGRGYRAGFPAVIGVPVLVGGYYGDYGLGYDPNAAPAPQQPVVNTPPAPPVVINQYFGSAQPGPDPAQAQAGDDSGIHTYTAPSSTSETPAALDPRTYLVAYKDHSVYSVLTYWIEGNTFHYVTTDNTHNQADLSLIDLDFTHKLNSDQAPPASRTR